MLIHKHYSTFVNVSLAQTFNITYFHYVVGDDAGVLDWWPYRFRGLPVVAREDKEHEMHRFDLTYDKAIEILEEGQPCGFSRAEGTVERAGVHRGRRLKVVAKLDKDDFFEGEAVWKIVHVGPETHGR